MQKNCTYKLYYKTLTSLSYSYTFMLYDGIQKLKTCWNITFTHTAKNLANTSITYPL